MKNALNPRPFPAQLLLTALLLSAHLPRLFAASPDYFVATTSGGLIITDVSSKDNTLSVTQAVAGSIQFAAAGRTFTLNGGTLLPNNTGNLSLTGVTNISIHNGSGNDTNSLSAFSGTTFPSLSIYGGGSNVTVNFNGSITFASGNSLDVELQDGTPRANTVNVAANAILVASGTGAITLLCSQNISLSSGAALQVQDGGLDVEANQQAVPATGKFNGVNLDGATLQATGQGPVTVDGTGGNDPGGGQLGVQVINGAKIIGDGGDIHVTGTGGASFGQINRGVTVYGAGSAITATGLGGVHVTGTAGKNGGYYGIGVSVLYGGEISSSGDTWVTGTGAGAPGSGYNQGVEIGQSGSLITALFNVNVTGAAGPGASSGIYMDNSAAITTPASGIDIYIVADSLALDATTGIITTNGGSYVSFSPLSATNVDLGGVGAPGTLGLPQSVLNQVTTSNLVVNGAGVAGITISAPITLANGENLYPYTAPGGLHAPANGTDLSLGTGVLTLQGPFDCVITNATPDSGFPQLNVAGDVNLSPMYSTLDLTGTTFAGTLGDTFTIINNAGPNHVVGYFGGLPEGAYLAWPGSPALAAQISYVGGDGNDVALTLVPVAQALTVTSKANSGPGSLPAILALAAAFSGAETITFDPSLAGQTITLASEIIVSNNLTFDATSLTKGLTISGGNATRLFSVAANGNLTLLGLSLTGGNGVGAALADNGGAICNQGTLSLVQCTLSGNSAIYGAGAIFSAGTLNMTNCTLSGNSAQDGGAINSYNTSGLTATLSHCTLTLNHATRTGYGGGAIDNFASTLSLNACLLAGNTSATTANGPDLRMQSGTLTATNCLIGDGTSSTLTNGVNGNLVGTTAAPIDARLLPLGDYGGLTQTMPPRADSPAVDAAPGSTLSVDQRGVARPVDGTLSGTAVNDIGAVEFNNFVEVNTTADELDVPAGATVSLRDALDYATAGALIYFSPTVFVPGTNTITLTQGELLPGQDVSITANGISTGVTLNGNNNSRILTVAESPVDITAATGTTATQSSDYSASDYLAGNGIDGNTSTFTSTADADPSPTWTADFHREVLMTRVELVNRTQCCQERLSDVTITLLDARGSVLYTSPVLNHANALNYPAYLSVTLPGPMAVWQVQVTRNPLDSVGDERTLSIAELEVFYTPAVSLNGLTLTGGNGAGTVSSGYGGAILNSNALTVTRCTLFGNNTTFGGALANGGTALFQQCTVASNSATGNGGAVANFGSLALTHCTVSGNGGNLDAVNNYAATLTLSNSIVAGNPVASPGFDIYNNAGTLNFTGSNIVQSFANFGATTTGPIPLNANPLLAPLGNYGGPTPTMALEPGSPARDGAVGSTITSDQRGFPVVNTPDIGAYEAGTLLNYDAWSWETFPANATVAQRARTADYDGDGRINVLEYALGSNPLVPDAGPALQLTLNAAHTASTNQFKIKFDSTDIVYELDRSTNLAAGWTPMFDYSTVTNDGDIYLGTGAAESGGIWKIIDRSITNRPQTFYRLQVTVAP